MPAILQAWMNGKWVDIPAIKGKDGFSPIVKMESDEETLTIKITDAEGEKIAKLVSPGGDMKKNIYDSNDDGIVDNAEKLGGAAPSAYRKTADQIDYQTEIKNKPVIKTSTGVTITVAASAWVGEEAPYTATVACSIATASNILFVGAAGDVSTAEQREAIRNAMIMATGQSAGSINLTADGEKPEMDIYVNVVEVI